MKRWIRMRVGCWSPNDEAFVMDIDPVTSTGPETIIAGLRARGTFEITELQPEFSWLYEGHFSGVWFYCEPSDLEWP